MFETNSTTIPCLPCESLDAALEFWQAMGFRVTYQQRLPNPYAAARFGDFEIHFFGLKQLKLQDNLLRREIPLLATFEKEQTK